MSPSDDVLGALEFAGCVCNFLEAIQNFVANKTTALLSANPRDARAILPPLCSTILNGYRTLLHGHVDVAYEQFQRSEMFLIAAMNRQRMPSVVFTGKPSTSLAWPILKVCQEVDVIFLPYLDDSSGEKLAADWPTLYQRITALLPPGSVHADWCRERLYSEAAVFGEDCTRYSNDSRPEAAADDAAIECIVTLQQAAAMVNRSKRTLEKHKTEMPAPRISDGGGKPDEWEWSELRPWLEKYSSRTLPKRFPADQFRKP